VHRTSKELNVIDIAILPEFRGQGIGGTLMRRLMDDAAAAGQIVQIHVEQNNPAQSLYRRLGFVPKPGTGEGIYHEMEWRAGNAASTPIRNGAQ
jgi:predicted GNAT family acetyltransferase